MRKTEKYELALEEYEKTYELNQEDKGNIFKNRKAIW